MAPPGIGVEVEGLHAVAAALAAGRVHELYIEASRLRTVGELADTARAAGVRVEIIDDVGPLARTDAPQGVVARCAPLPTYDIEDVVAAVTPAALLVLDHLEDPRNVGAIARSAAAAGLGGMVVAERRSAPLSATAFKAAAGALETLKVASVSSVAQALDRLGKLGLWTVGLDAAGPDRLFGLALFTEPVAVVIGAEGGGLGRLVSARCDVVAHIPLAAGVESLNAAVAASLASFEIARART